MKTKNNVTKKAARFFAVFAAACLVGTGVLAADAKKAAPVKTKKAQAKSETSVLMPVAAETIIEAPIEIENWMTDPKNFELSKNATTKVEETSKQRDRKIEMVVENKSGFGRRLFVIFEEEAETDTPMVLQQWMVKPQNWNL
jgi:hypothetical protein